MINIVCRHCHKSIQVILTIDIPLKAVYGACNFCPKCEDFMDNAYEDYWY